MSCNPHNVIRAEIVANMFGSSITCVQQPNNRYHKYYLGKGLFVRSEIEELKYRDEAEAWFRAEIGLFIEYLNKIKHISYSDIARKIGTTAISSIAFLRIGVKMGAKILVKYRKYLVFFDTYYRNIIRQKYKNRANGLIVEFVKDTKFYIWVIISGRIELIRKIDFNKYYSKE